MMVLLNSTIWIQSHDGAAKFNQGWYTGPFSHILVVGLVNYAHTSRYPEMTSCQIKILKTVAYCQSDSTALQSTFHANGWYKQTISKVLQL